MMIDTSSTRLLVSAVILLAISYLSLAQTQATTTTPSPDEVFCNSFVTCETCLAQQPSGSRPGCYFCGNPGLTRSGDLRPNCKAYFVTNGLEVVTDGSCPVLDYNVQTCLLKAYVIVILIITAVIIFVIAICVVSIIFCVICYRRRVARRTLRDERMYQDARDQIRQAAANRKADRREKNDEIRRKYGLGGEGNGDNYGALNIDNGLH